ncbi:two-component system histidine kinase PnpS [Paenibacillus agilis]|uniref:histidine kinase n=1 Tax=Paenibacillus agilis TaxID=3020863 RepID=A0A559IXI4_9BACL|nr:ATP-binding protein [Paenibacillus agilis]TVX92339.1 cell wall metabolism sensor histidine kinase WalK [Paenibacillus agilis]
MSRFRNRLTLTYVLMVGLSVLAAGIYMTYSFKDSHIKQLEQTMVQEIKMLDTMLEWRSFDSAEDRSAYYTTWAKALQEATDTRVTFVLSDGTVTGDSNYDVSSMDNHLQREEIQQAAKGYFGSIIRFSNTLNENMLYVAGPIQHPGKFEGYVRLAKGLAEVEAGVRQLLEYLVIGLAGLFLAAAIVSYRIAHKLTRPIENMTRVALRIAKRDYSARVEATGKDELGQLGSAINAMADSLEEQVDEIRENESRLRSVLDHMMNGIVMVDANGRVGLMNGKAEQLFGLSCKECLGKNYTDIRIPSELQVIISEVMMYRNYVQHETTVYYPEERLLDIHAVPVYYTDDEWAGLLLMMQDLSELRRLERMRSEFVANVSHELKTPIAAVKGFAETLLNGAIQDAETAHSFVQIIHDESERLNRLIGDLLELSKIQSRQVPMQYSPVHLPSLLEQTVHILGKNADRKEIEITLQVTDDLFIEADEDRLRQIVLNLLSNAINYTPEGGKVKLCAKPILVGTFNDSEPDEQIEISITDTGIGIPKKDLPRIFERFYRVDKARSRSSGGTGLGLSIVKHLVESHHGTLKVESEVGVGTTFTITLPIIQDAPIDFE